MSTTTTPNTSASTKNSSNPQKSQQPQQQQSKPQQQSSIFNAQTFKANWQQLVGLAKNQWSRLTEEDLTKACGDEQKLTMLVKDRYSLKQDEAGRQVKEFLTKNSSK